MKKNTHFNRLVGATEMYYDVVVFILTYLNIIIKDLTNYDIKKYPNFGC
jgi:hypothetical protein